MTQVSSLLLPMAFVGGGNMANTLIGGLIRHGAASSAIRVVEPFAATAQALQAQHGVAVQPAADASLKDCALVVWAVKPQVFKEAALLTAPFVANALHLSVAAGITSNSIAQWLHTERVVRAMPNTPALVGLGQTGLYARSAVSPAEKAAITDMMGLMGESLWVDTEVLLDAVTALSGSGPAYVFYFLEAMVDAGVHMGLTPAQAHQLAVGTFVGASELARSSSETPAVLRERVTSKGGTTFAALSVMQEKGLHAILLKAMQAAQERAKNLGQELGG
jgi:pyrroline-5-carboxylate reductase